MIKDYVPYYYNIERFNNVIEKCKELLGTEQTKFTENAYIGIDSEIHPVDYKWTFYWNDFEKGQLLVRGSEIRFIEKLDLLNKQNDEVVNSIDELERLLKVRMMEKKLSKEPDMKDYLQQLQQQMFNGVGVPSHMIMGNVGSFTLSNSKVSFKAK